MPDYKEMYFTLFRELTKVIDQPQQVRQKMEEMYIDSEDNLTVFENKE